MASQAFKRDWTNRYLVWPEPDMVAFGALIRRGRHFAGMTQVRLAERSGISQSVISRFERGLAPGMSVERLVRLATAIGPMLPLGFCPHPHVCDWSRSTAAARPAWSERR